jgi:antagonist of KipI
VTVALAVVEPGLMTTIQDLGRPGAIAAGVPPGGAMDRFAHRAANLLVGNAPQDATLECTLKGPVLMAAEACLVAIAGADLDPHLDGEPVETWTAFTFARGSRLSIGLRRSGARAYVAIAGGFEGERWLGSRSTSLMTGRGGMRGRALAAGDELSVAVVRAAPVGPRRLEAALRPDYSRHVLEVMPGPHARRLDAESKRALFAETFAVGVDSNRMGYRLEGPSLAARGDELLSFGLVAGAVQLPGSGQPIVLMADHQTAGGYPVIATVVSASMPVAAQLAPGDALRFAQISAAQAHARRKQQADALASLAAL